MSTMDRTRRTARRAPARPGVRGGVAEARLGVDDRGDERRVELLVLGLLADDVLVAQRERDLLHRVVDLGQEDGRAAGDHRDGGEQERDTTAQGDPPCMRAPRAAPGAGHRAHALSLARISDSWASRSEIVPSLRTT